MCFEFSSKGAFITYIQRVQCIFTANLWKSYQDLLEIFLFVYMKRKVESWVIKFALRVRQCLNCFLFSCACRIFPVKICTLIYNVSTYRIKTSINSLLSSSTVVKLPFAGT
uniref:Uncharacterized protein n=1 Tax=Schistocephalus solidus TaxID=70667 RepID=A0A0X3PP76_SCHSO